MTRLVIVGSGMAAAKLLEELAARSQEGQGSDFRITVIGDEPLSSYNRILLSSVLCGDKTADQLSLLDNDWYRRHRIEMRTGERVTAVDTAGKTLATDSGTTIAWDKLVFATGSRPHFPVIDGIHADNVMGFRTLGDLEKLSDMAPAHKRALVVGGGLLGLEAAHGLQALGLRVTLVHRRQWLMNRQLDRAAGQLLQEKLEERGMAFAMGVEPDAILTTTADGQQQVATGVSLSDRRALEASLVLFAAGIQPNTELARQAGIVCKKGILVDERLQTEVPDIYALGECCQIGEQTFGLVAPVWRQAEVLAANLTGNNEARYRHREAPTRLKVSGIDLFSAGETDGDQHQLTVDRQAGVYRRLILRDNKIVGAILLGDRTGSAWYGELIDNGTDISPFRPWLIFGREYCQIAP